MQPANSLWMLLCMLHYMYSTAQVTTDDAYDRWDDADPRQTLHFLQSTLNTVLQQQQTINGILGELQVCN